MNILIDIGHPGHVHLFKNLFLEVVQKNHNVFITVKDIKIIKDLLDHYKIPFITIGSKKDSLWSKATSQLLFNIKTWWFVRKNNIQLGIGTSVTLAHVSRFTKLKSILLDDDDDDVQPLFVNYVHPYADHLISPDVLRGKRKREDTVYYPGLHELAYLHPKRFNPDKTVLLDLGLVEDETFFILRFNIFKAHHDSNAKGLSLEQKHLILEMLLPLGKVFITTEREIEPTLKKYQLTVSPDKVHSLLYYAKMFIGDSQTMTSEAAVLGTPSIRCNSFAGKISYLEEEENKYGLTYGFQPHQFEELIKKVKEILSMENLDQVWENKRQKLLKDKIDSTKFYLWLIENNEQIAETDFNEEFFSQFK